MFCIEAKYFKFLGSFLIQQEIITTHKIGNENIYLESEYFEIAIPLNYC